MGKYWSSNKTSLKRTLVKSIVWRAIAFVRGTFIAWCFLGNIRLSLKISVVGTAVAFITYFIYEMIWDKIEWENGHKDK